MDWAAESAERGDYAGALAWLEAVEAVDGELPEIYEAKRAEWLGAIGADRTGR